MMKESKVLDDFNSSVLQGASKWTHFALFYFIQIIFLTGAYFWAGNVKGEPTDLQRVIFGGLLIICPLVLAGIMIYTFKGKQKMSFWKKALTLFGQILLSYLTIYTLNFTNILGRDIPEAARIEGLKLSAVYVGILFFLGLIVVSLVKSRVITGKD